MASDSRDEAMLGPYHVLDLTDEQGYYCGQLLGQLGADVVKVEPPGGDAGRRIPPFVHDEPDPEKSLYWLALNTNKRGITLDTGLARGQEVFRELVKRADVVVESFPPGHLDKLGLGWAALEAVNPRLVLTSVTPFGSSGPYRGYKGSDLVGWAMGGLLAQTGDPERPPVRVSHVNFAYSMAGMDAAWGTVMALYARGQTGRGQQVTVSVQKSVAKTNFMAHEVFEVTGKEQKRASSFYRVERSDVKLRSVWECRDGYVAFLIFGGHWGATHDNPRLVQWLDEEGMADDYLRGLDWSKLRWRHQSPEEVARIHSYMERFFKSKTKAELLEGAIKRRLAIQPVNAPSDILAHPQLKSRGYWQPVEQQNGESLLYPGRFCLPSVSPCRHWRRAPRIGEHNDEVYCGELGMSAKQVADLIRDRVL